MKLLGRAAWAAAAIGLMLGSASLPTDARAASIDSQFKKAVERLLMNMKEGPVSVMSKQEKRDLVACVNGVFGGIPDEKKRFIVEAPNQDELRARYDEVGLENRAKLQQQVRDECA